MFGALYFGAVHAGSCGSSVDHGAVYKLALDLPSNVGVFSEVVNPSLLTGNSERVTGVVTLSAPATSVAARVQLVSSDPSIAAVNDSVMVPAGSTQASFNIQTHVVSASKTAIITATYHGIGASGSVIVTPMPTDPIRAALVLSPASADGTETTTNNRVYLTGNATSDTLVTLTSSNPSLPA